MPDPLTLEKVAGWILYDNSCGFCRRWVPFWERTLLKRGFAIAPLQAEWVKQRLHLTDSELLQDLRLLLLSGELIVGANVYRYAMKKIWWAYPIYLLTLLPILHDIFNWGYKTFAANRYHVSRVCRMETSNKYKKRE